MDNRPAPMNPRYLAYLKNMASDFVDEMHFLGQFGIADLWFDRASLHSPESYYAYTIIWSNDDIDRDWFDVTNGVVVRGHTVTRGLEQLSRETMESIYAMALAHNILTQ